MNSTPTPRQSGWRLSLLGLLCLALITSAFANHARATRFSSLVIFGDSLSDTGRLYDLSKGGFPMKQAYWHGRESNGPVWVEYLAAELGLLGDVQNYAVIGAMSAPTAEIPSGNVWSDTFTGLEGTSISGQVDKFLADHNYVVDPNALYIVEGGSNDLLHPVAALLLNPPADTAAFQAAVGAIITPTIINMTTVVAKLRAYGARNIAFVMVPDFGNAPRINAYGAQAQAVVSLIITLVNENLETQLENLEAAGGSKMARIDGAAIINKVVASPASFWLRNATGQFMTIDTTTLKVTYADKHPFMANFWFFWDELHPTTRGHAIFCSEAFPALDAVFPILPFRGRH
jgi:outer membrane lipase/esterase